MLSSFIALAAGLIGGVDIAEATQPPAAIIAPAPAAPRTIEQAVAPTPPDTAPSIVVPVQATPQDIVPEPAPQPAEPAPMPQTPRAQAPEVELEPVQKADPSIVSPTERRAILRAASNALARIETAQGRFVLIDINGDINEGSFYLQRPGRVRFDYDDPVPLLIASDGATVAIVDEELESIDRVPLASTPLGLLLDDDVDLESDAEVIRVQRASGIVAITVVDPTEQAAGELTLIFDAGTYDLMSWRVVDANGGVTSTQLSDVRTGMSLNPRLFIVREFDEDDDRRR